MDGEAWTRAIVTAAGSISEMAITIKSTGPMLDGQWRSIVPSGVAQWTAGVLELLKREAQQIAPVDTGRYRSSITVEKPVVRGYRVTGGLFSSDIPGKVRVIEFGFPARRPDLKGRRAVLVFTRTLARHRGLLATQTRVLESNLAFGLTRGGSRLVPARRL